MSLTWNGDAIQRKALDASRFGIDQTMALSVTGAKSELYPGHGWKFGVLQGSLQMRPAVVRGDSVSGFWGSFIVEYADFIEQGSGRFKGYHYLQNNADKQYPKLAGRIAKRFAA